MENIKKRDLLYDNGNSDRQYKRYRDRYHRYGHQYYPVCLGT